MMISYELLESQWLMSYLFVCPTTGFTREVILGTTNDQLYETTVEEKDKKEKYRKLLFEIMQLQSLLLVYRWLLSEQSVLPVYWSYQTKECSVRVFLGLQILIVL